MKEKKESEEKIESLKSKLSRDTKAKDREDELLKAAMYHVRSFNMMISTEDSVALNWI